MPTIQELEKQLADAKAMEKVNAFETLLQRAKESLHHRCFVMHWQTRSGAWKGHTGAHAVRYSVTNTKRHDGHIEIKTRNIWAGHSSSPTRSFEEGFGRRDYGSENLDPEQPWKLGEITAKHNREIDSKEFKELWELVNSVGEHMIARISKAMDAMVHAPIEESKTVTPVDLPFITLTPPESTYVNGWFLLPDYRMLITRNSVQAVRERIAEERALERRLAGHFQECDRRYLEQKAETLASLESKLRSEA